jgi:hypothetical protein
LNRGPPAPEAGALTGLRYAPYVGGVNVIGRPRFGSPGPAASPGKYLSARRTKHSLLSCQPSPSPAPGDGVWPRRSSSLRQSPLGWQSGRCGGRLPRATFSARQLRGLPGVRRRAGGLLAGSPRSRGAGVLRAGNGAEPGGKRHTLGSVVRRAAGGPAVRADQPWGAADDAPLKVST